MKDLIVTSNLLKKMYLEEKGRLCESSSDTGKDVSQITLSLYEH